MLQQLEDDRRARDQVDRVFKKLDLNQDGVITIEEFIESCLKVGTFKIIIINLHNFCLTYHLKSKYICMFMNK